MLSLFPSLFTYSLLVGLILRLTLGVVTIFWSYRRIMSKPGGSFLALAIIEGIAGILLIIGLFTQFAALVIGITLAVKLIDKARRKSLFTDGINYYFILLMIAVCLLFTGAGALAFDLPL